MSRDREATPAVKATLPASNAGRATLTASGTATTPEVGA